MLLEWLNARNVDYAMRDVTREPVVSPRGLKASEAQSILDEGKYLGKPIPEEDREAVRTSPRETPAMFALRLAQDSIHVRPGWYFQWRPVPRLDQELLEYARELWDHAQDLTTARRIGRWPCNSGACMTYKMPCKFLGICGGYDRPDLGAPGAADPPR